MRRYATLTAIVVICAVTLGFAAPNWVSINGPIHQPEVTVLKATESETILECNIAGFYSDDVFANGETFQDLSFPGYYTTLEIGKPQLPVITEIVAIPAGAKVRVDVEVFDSKVISGYNVMPYQTPVLENQVSATFDKDAKAYLLDDLYPAKIAEVNGQGDWRSLKVATLKVYPVQYNAVKDELVIHSNIKVTLTYSGSTDGYNTGRSIPESYDRIFSNTVINYDRLNLPVRQFGSVRTEAYDLLIIAADAYVAGLGSFVTYKEAAGYSTTLVPVSTVGYTVTDIKNYIQDEYDNNDISYVLLVGNENDIPGYTGYSSFSDYYYTLLDGGDDFADIGIGRFCIHNSTELGWMLEKSVAYESDPPTGDWLDNALLVANAQNAPYKYQQCKERIRTAEETPSGTYSVLYPEFTTAYGADSAYGGDNATNADVIEYINEGMRVVNYRGHGSYTAWSSWNYLGQSFGPSQIDSLDNGAMTPILFSIACYNNNIQYGSYCLGEYFTLTEDAAVAVLSASRPSYTVANHTYDKKLFSAIFDEGINATSDASNAAAALIITQHGSIGLANARMYIWLGDPTLQVIYEEPEPVVRHVPAQYGTIQAAINACNDLDTVMVASGTYNEAIDFLGKNIVVTSSGGADVTTIHGVYRSRPVVYFQSGEPKGAELSGFTITFGQKSGIYIYRSSPTVKDCIITGNYSQDSRSGGGISLIGTVGAVIRDNIILENHAYEYGAGMYLERCNSDTIAYNVIYKNWGNTEVRCIASNSLFHNNIIIATEALNHCITSQEHGDIVLKSNILMKGSRCAVYAFDGGTAAIYYNCFYSNRENWCGDIIVGHGNFDRNPLLTKDWRTPPESPCLDAGWPGLMEPRRYWPDPDGTRNDIGVFPVYQVDVSNGPVYYSIQRAVNAVEDGDFVLVHPGAYHPVNFIGKRIVVTSSEGPERTSIVGAMAEAPCVYMQSGEPKGAELSGFTVRGGGRGAIYCYRSSPTILDNIIKENTSSELYRGAGVNLIHTSAAVVKGNTFTHNVHEGYGADIVAQYARNDTICYNLFESSYGRGTIYIENSEMALYNNTLDGIQTDGHGICAMVRGYLDCRNNIIVNFPTYGFYAGGDARITADYNDVYRYGLRPYAGNVDWGRNNIEADPIFVDYYRLDLRSPCVDRGDPDPFFNDPDNTRNDMGWKALSMLLARGSVEIDENPAIPSDFALKQNYPNPFNATAIIEYALPEASQVTVKVYDILGRMVTTLVDGYEPAGYYQVKWNAEGVPSGTYFYRIQAQDFSDSKKMLLLK